VFVVCVNDGAVMTAWKKDQGVAGSEKIEFVADTQGDLTKALNLTLTAPDVKTAGPGRVLGAHTNRCKRSAMLVEDGIIKVLKIAEKGPEGQEDPAGDDFPEVTLVENFLPLCK